jgi:DNA-binding transcriptional ArsR family regulator
MIVLDALFEALANEHRRRIIYSLSMHPYSISRLASLTRLSLPAIHKHIKILKKSRLIIERKNGRVRFLSLNRDSLLVLQKWLTQFHPYWGHNKETLENYTKYLKGGEKN